MALSERPSKGQIEKFFKRNALPAAAGLLALGLAGGCANVDFIKFPKCEIDPQPHSATGALITDSWFIPKTIQELLVEGVTLRQFDGNTREIEIISQKPNIVTFVEKDHVRFRGDISGRNIDIKFSPPKETTIGRIEIKANINTTCDLEAKQKP